MTQPDPNAVDTVLKGTLGLLSGVSDNVELEGALLDFGARAAALTPVQRSIARDVAIKSLKAMGIDAPALRLSALSVAVENQIRLYLLTTPGVRFFIGNHSLPPDMNFARLPFNAVTARCRFTRTAPSAIFVALEISLIGRP